MTTQAQFLDELRAVAFGIAYRMLGTVSEAEDIAQEALLRVHRALENGERLESPRAFVGTVTTRLAIDELRSARARREHYIGEWLPEPIITANGDDPAQHAEMADSLSFAMLVVLNSLSPEERAVLLLRDVFDYDYARIAEIIDKSQDNTRQLAVRARRHVESRRPRFRATRQQQQDLTSRFFAAVQDGDLAALERVLAHDISFVGDGGGNAPALLRPLSGRSRVAQTLINWTERAALLPGVRIQPAEINGGEGALLLDGKARLIGVWALEFGSTQIQTIRSIVNPDKLAHLGPTRNLRTVLFGRTEDGR